MPVPADNRLIEALGTLKPKSKEPNSCRVLDNWIAAAERELGTGGGRIGWLVSTALVSAKLQRVVDRNGTSRFAMKGGTLLQYRLGLSSRTTRDLDGIVSGDMDTFFEELENVLSEPWGVVEFGSTPPELIDVPGKPIKPRRFHIICKLRGQPWRNVKVELSAEEGAHGTPRRSLAAPPLDRFGLPALDQVISIDLAYQIAEKYHGASEPDNPPAYINDRARDVVDPLLLRNLCLETGAPTDAEVAHALYDIFECRARDAEAMGMAPRELPSPLSARDQWHSDFARACSDAGLEVGLDEAVAMLNEWVKGLLAAA